MRAYIQLNREFGADPLWSEVSMREYDVLYTLAKSREPLSQSELLSAVLLSQPAVSRMLGRMEDKGWLQRERCPRDGRTVRFSLTELGRETQRRIGRAHGRQLEERIGGALSVSQQAALKDLCTTLTKKPEGK